MSKLSTRRSFGLVDIDRDISAFRYQHYPENALSKLESQDSTKRKDFEAKNPCIQITRPVRNVARKFLFITIYQGKGFHKRFTGYGPQGHVEADKNIISAIHARQDVSNTSRCVVPQHQDPTRLKDWKHEACRGSA